MTTLIVPTDFSPAAEHAALYAAGLAQKIQARLLLLHVYQLPVPMTDFPVLLVTADDLKKAADEGLQRAKEKLETTVEGVTIETESRLGEVVTEIEEACKAHSLYALVVGTKELNGFERMLLGDTTLSLVKHTGYPVIAVPEKASLHVPNNIALATDLQSLDDIPAEKISGIVNALQATLHVVHVTMKHENTIAPETLMQTFADTNASFHAIDTEHNVEDSIRDFVVANSIDLVLLLPHKHSLYERLFFRGHTEGILHSMPVPVMSLRNE